MNATMSQDPLTVLKLYGELIPLDELKQGTALITIATETRRFQRAARSAISHREKRILDPDGTVSAPRTR
jgi:hypothetical protein